jgi:hypothetical protein
VSASPSKRRRRTDQLLPAGNGSRVKRRAARRQPSNRLPAVAPARRPVHARSRGRRRAGRAGGPAAVSRPGRASRSRAIAARLAASRPRAVRSSAAASGGHRAELAPSPAPRGGAVGSIETGGEPWYIPGRRAPFGIAEQIGRRRARALVLALADAISEEPPPDGPHHESPRRSRPAAWMESPAARCRRAAARSTRQRSGDDHVQAGFERRARAGRRHLGGLARDGDRRLEAPLSRLARMARERLEFRPRNFGAGSAGCLDRGGSIQRVAVPDSRGAVGGERTSLRNPTSPDARARLSSAGSKPRGE